MSVIDEYLAPIASPQKEELERIRSLVKMHVPDAEEVISYAMPGFKYKGKYLLTFAAFKDHMSIFPGASPVALVKQLVEENYRVSKGTIQFTADKPLAEEVLVQIIENCVARIDGA